MTSAKYYTRSIYVYSTIYIYWDIYHLAPHSELLHLDILQASVREIKTESIFNKSKTKSKLWKRLKWNSHFESLGNANGTQFS